MKKSYKAIITVTVIGIILLGFTGNLFQQASASVQSNHNHVDKKVGQQNNEVFVPGGEFYMGCSSDFSTVKCDGDAQPIHVVYVDSFYIDRTEVSNGDYAVCEAAGACPSPLDIESKTRPDYYTNPIYSNYPVLHVDWGRAAAYCSWQGKRLPTEAEWEKAARGADLRLYPWGNEVADCEKANIARLDYSQCVGDTQPVDSYSNWASPYGALNMVGNVREWVNDLYKKFYYGHTPYYNPPGPDSTDQGEHLVRGGSWCDHIDGGSNNWVRIDEAGIYDMYAIGFRCARDAGPGGTPTPTPVPTPTPTPLPSPASKELGAAGGALWQTYEDHLTLLEVPAGGLSTTAQFTITYTTLPDMQGDLQGFNHFLTLSTEQAPAPTVTLNLPLRLRLGFDEILGVKAETVQLYRQEGSAWITQGLTISQSYPGYIIASIDELGTYGLLGETHRLHLPLILRDE